MTDISAHAPDPPPDAPDRFVAIEGIDGAGKSTLVGMPADPRPPAWASGSSPPASGAGRLSRRNFVPSSSTKATRSRIAEESPLGSVPLAGSDDAVAGVRPAVETVTAVAGTVTASAEGRAPAPRDLATGRMDQHRPIMEPASKIESGSHSQLWMRAVSFAGLHRILKAVGDAPRGLRANEVNDLVLKQKVVLTPANPHPKPTTLYHYRTTLLRLNAVIRKDRKLIANVSNPDVDALLCEPAPANGEQTLSDAARERFAALVLGTEDCRRLFFDLFMSSSRTSFSVSDFRKAGVPVIWVRRRGAARCGGRVREHGKRPHDSIWVLRRRVVHPVWSALLGA